MPDYNDDEDFLQDEGPSKTALKRQMTELQELGETLCGLSDKVLEKIPLADEQLKAAILESRRIRSNNARRRHLQYIGKLMRNIDAEPIRAALEEMQQQRQRRNDAFHQLEQWRDDLLAQGTPGIEAILERFPTADRQQLRQLVLQHQREVKAGKPPAASRKLFRYLRELASLIDD